MKYKKKLTCSQIRILGSGMMAAGFLLLCTAVGTYGGSDGLSQCFLAVGGVWLAAGFAIKLAGWRCPQCRAHLMLCAEWRARECPCCGCHLQSGKMGQRSGEFPQKKQPASKR